MPIEWEHYRRTVWLGYGKVLWQIKEKSMPVHYVETGVTEANHGFYLSAREGGGGGFSKTLDGAKALAEKREEELPSYSVELEDGSGTIEYLAFESDVIPVEEQPKVVGRLLRWDWLLQRGYAVEDDRPGLDRLLDTRVQDFHARPSLEVSRSWSWSDAVESDGNDRLIDEIREAVTAVFAAVDQPFVGDSAS